MKNFLLAAILLMSLQVLAQDDDTTGGKTGSCLIKNLSSKFDIKISYETINDSCRNTVSLIDKLTGKTIQVFELYIDLVFSNCNAVRSYSTGLNEDSDAWDNEYGDVIVADFNFDSKEDIAIKYNETADAGPMYNFYIQGRDGKFVLDTFLTSEMAFFPQSINKKNKTLITLVHASAADQCESTFKFNSAKNK